MSYSRLRFAAIASTVLITLGSFGGGSVQRRGSLLELLGVEFLAFGHGAAFSNVTLLLGTIAFVWVWVLVGREVIHKNLDTSQLTRLMVAWLTPLLVAAPIMSRDVYSYLMQGSMLRDGFDPYVEGPAANPNQILFEVSHDWRNTTTPYGPLHLWIGEGVTRLVGDNVLAGVFVYKVLSLIGFALIAWGVIRITGFLVGSPTFALWLGVANPVMVFHLVAGMHNESIMVGLVSVGIVWAFQRRFIPAVAIISAAMALKASAALALPFIVWIALLHPGKRHILVRFITTSALGVLTCLGTLWVITWASGSNWGWVAELTGNAKVINPLSAPSLIASLIAGAAVPFTETFPYNEVLAVTRGVFMILAASSLVWIWWSYRTRPVQGMMWAYAAAFTFNAVTLPWYYASVLSLAGVSAQARRALNQGFIGFSIIVALAFTGSGNHQFYNPIWMTLLLAAAVFSAWWVYQPAKTRVLVPAA